MATARLAGATVARDADLVRLTYQIEGTLPDRGSWSVSTTFVRADTGPMYQLGVQVVEGEVNATFVFHFASATQHNYSDVVPEHSDGTWSVSFADVGLDLGVSGTWHADLDLDGHAAGSIAGTY